MRTIFNGKCVHYTIEELPLTSLSRSDIRTSIFPTMWGNLSRGAYCRLMRLAAHQKATAWFCEHILWIRLSFGPMRELLRSYAEEGEELAEILRLLEKDCDVYCFILSIWYRGAVILQPQIFVCKTFSDLGHILEVESLDWFLEGVFVTVVLNALFLCGRAQVSVLGQKVLPAERLMSCEGSMCKQFALQFKLYCTHEICSEEALGLSLLSAALNRSI